MKFTTTPDYTTIDGRNPKPIPGSLISFIQNLYPNPLFTKDDLQPLTCHLSTSMGPNGPSMKTSLDDLKILPDQLMEDLFTLANDEDNVLAEFFRIRPYADLEATKDRDPTLRRLAELDDKEGKKRLIAIFDYWSQACLKPLHKALAQLLRANKHDCTFNQSHFRAILDDPSIIGQNIYSIDLKAATDLMPLELQRVLLGKLIGDDNYADAWASVMVDYGFQCPDGAERYYTQGQPMGAYSS